MSPIGDDCSACEYCYIRCHLQKSVAISDTLAFPSSAERIYLIVSRSALEACCRRIYFLGHRYKACHHLDHQDVFIYVGALQNVQGVRQAEDAHVQPSDLEAGQADVPQASTSSVRGDRAIATLMGMRVGYYAIPDVEA